MGKVISIKERAEARRAGEALNRQYVDVNDEHIFVKLPGGELEVILSAGEARELACEILDAADQAEGSPGMFDCQCYDPYDTQMLAELREVIDQEFGWASTEQHSLYFDRVKQIGALLRKLGVHPLNRMSSAKKDGGT